MYQTIKPQPSKPLSYSR